MKGRFILIFLVIVFVLSAIYISFQQRVTSFDDTAIAETYSEKNSNDNIDTANVRPSVEKEVDPQASASSDSSKAQEGPDTLEEDLTEAEEAKIYELEEFMAEARENNAKCEQALSSVFQDPQFIDPRNEKYLDPQYIHQTLDQLEEVLSSFSPAHIYQHMEEMVQENVRVDPLEFTQNTLEISGCLSPRMESFMMSAFDAMFYHEYEQDQIRPVVERILNGFLQTPVVQAPSLLSLSFQLNNLRLLERTGLFEMGYGDLLSDLQSEMMEDHREFSEVLYGGSGSVDDQRRRREIFSDFQKRAILQDEIHRIMEDMRRDLARGR